MQSREPWKCPSCTLENPGQATYCGACDTERPPEVAMEPDIPPNLKACAGIDPSQYNEEYEMDTAAGGHNGLTTNQNIEVARLASLQQAVKRIV